MSPVKLVIFGERPGPNTDPKRPLYPHTTTGAAARLISLLGVSLHDYLNKTLRYNVYHNGNWEVSTREARDRVEIIVQEALGSMQNPRFLFVGRATAQAGPRLIRDRAFGLPLGRMMVIPHTSGVSRFWNSDEDTARILLAVREFTEDCF